eukprot:6152047-Prymnesium_polylepis.1
MLPERIVLGTRGLEAHPFIVSHRSPLPTWRVRAQRVGALQLDQAVEGSLPTLVPLERMYEDAFADAVGAGAAVDDVQVAARATHGYMMYPYTDT